MYSTLADYRAYAASVGAVLPVADADATRQLVKACEYIDSKEARLIGRRTERDQDNAYPRSGLVLNGAEYTDTEIPALVKRCERALALDINAGIDLFNFAPLLPVVKERVEGAVEVQYAAPSRVSTSERESVAMSMLKQLMLAPSLSIPLERV
jgi:hypothetical protein